MSNCRLALIAPLATLFLVTGIPERVSAQVGSWVLSGRIDVTATVGRRVMRRTQGFRALLEISSDGTYRQPGSLLCSAGVTDAAEVGLWRPLSRKRFILEPLNLDALVSAAVDCFGEGLDISVVIEQYHHVVRLQGGRLRGRSVARGRIVIGSQRVGFTAVARFRGLPNTDDALPFEDDAIGMLATGVRAQLGER